MNLKKEDFGELLISNCYFNENAMIHLDFHKDIEKVYLKVPEKKIPNIFNQNEKQPDAIHYSDFGFGLIEKKGKNQRENELVEQIEGSFENFENKFDNNSKVIEHKINYSVLVAPKLNQILSKTLKVEKNQIVRKKSKKPYTIKGKKVYYSKNKNSIK